MSEPIVDKAQLLLVTGVTASGKTSVVEYLLETQGFVERVITSTDRVPRPGEIPDKDYYFHTAQEFQRRKEAGLFVETVTYAKYSYGTEKSSLEKVFKARKLPILNIELRGARVFRAAYPNALALFLMPPNLEQLKGRFERRGDPAEAIAARLEEARRELEEWRDVCDICLISPDGGLEKTKQQVRVLLQAYYGNVI